MGKKRSRKFEVRVTVGFSVDDHEKLNEIADREAVSISWVVRKAVSDYLGQEFAQSQLPLQTKS